MYCIEKNKYSYTSNIDLLTYQSTVRASFTDKEDTINKVYLPTYQLHKHNSTYGVENKRAIHTALHRLKQVQESIIF